MSNSNSTIFVVVVDKLSKYADFIPFSHPYTTFEVARLFFYYIFNLHGQPKFLVCDRDPPFTSVFWKGLFCLNRTSFNFSSSCHPQIDGQCEVVNRTLEMYLRCFTSSRLKEWMKWPALMGKILLQRTQVGIQLLISPIRCHLWARATKAFELHSRTLDVSTHDYYLPLIFIQFHS